MKITMSGLLPLMVMIGGSSLEATAQQANEEAGVKACLENYMSGDVNRMEKAFHPSATVKFIDYQSGAYKDNSLAEFMARVKSSPNMKDRKVELLSMNIEGNAAQAKIRIETDKVIMNDYMNLLKIDGEWKIVSKIFSRKDK